MVINYAFYPSLMWNYRFSSLSGDPFDPSAGVPFPLPEGTSLSYLPHLLDAQAFIPPTERTEVGGLRVPGRQRRDPRGGRAPAQRGRRATGSSSAGCSPRCAPAAPITYEMVARAIAEFEFSLTFANAPIDRYARGELERARPSRRSAAPSSSSARRAA